VQGGIRNKYKIPVRKSEWKRAHGRSRHRNTRVWRCGLN